jgi:hypothetical protein
MNKRVQHAVAATLALGLLAWAAMPRLAADTLPVDVLNADRSTKEAQCAKLQAAIAADPKNIDLRYQLGALLCDMGSSGNETDADAALDLFAKLNKEAPKDAEVLAFYGNACIIHAKYAFILLKLHWTSVGFAHLDAAVAAAPDDLNVRIVRALNSAQVPDYLHRDKIAREDFDWVTARLQTHPEEFSPALRRAFYYFAGKFAFLHDEPACVGLLVKAADSPPTPGDVLAPKIQSYLDKARAKFPAS